MFEFAMQHQFWFAVALYWIFSAAVSAMPAPAGSNGPGYIWMYRFFHTLAGNVTTAFGGKIPGAVLGFLLTLAFVLLPSACSAHYVVHPGAINLTDSAAYDALLIAQATIDQARTMGLKGDSLNALIRAYNVAHESWLVFREAPDIYSTQLNADMANLTNAIRAFREGN